MPTQSAQAAWRYGVDHADPPEDHLGPYAGSYSVKPPDTSTCSPVIRPQPVGPGARALTRNARAELLGPVPSGLVDPADLSPAVPFERSFDAQIGVDYDRIAPDEVVATFVVRAELLDSGGRLHGGVLTAVAEGTASMGTAAGVMKDGMAASGMSNDTTVVADVTEGRLTAVARRRAAAPDLWVWDVEITGDDGRTCSQSLVTIAVRPMR